MPVPLACPDTAARTATALLGATRSRRPGRLLVLLAVLVLALAMLADPLWRDVAAQFMVGLIVTASRAVEDGWASLGRLLGPALAQLGAAPLPASLPSVVWEFVATAGRCSPAGSRAAALPAEVGRPAVGEGRLNGRLRRRQSSHFAKCCPAHAGFRWPDAPLPVLLRVRAAIRRLLPRHLEHED